MSLVDKLNQRVTSRGQAQKPPPAVIRSPSLSEKLTEKAESGVNLQSAEIRRIIQMELWRSLDPAEQEEYSRANTLAEAYENGFRLFPSQANAVYTYECLGKLFGIIGIGWGKTLTTLMVAGKALSSGADHVVLCIPPELVAQFVTRDIKQARTWIPLGYPIHILAGRSPRGRLGIARQRRPGLYVTTYSLMSRPDAYEILETLQPSVVIGDEAHRLANKSAARTRRVIEYLRLYQPACAWLSGTITDKSISDYYELIRFALGRHNPLPNASALATEWGALLDASATDPKAINQKDDLQIGGTGSMMPLLTWAQNNFPDARVSESIPGVREAYRLRLHHAPGVVASGDADIGCSLLIQNHAADQDKSKEHEQLQELIRQVEERWLTPNEDEIEYAVQKFKWLYELSAGFYNELSWPSTEAFAKHAGISGAEADLKLLKAMAAHEAHQEYARQLRPWLKDSSPPGLDTPFLVGQEMHRYGAEKVPKYLYDAWVFWKDQVFEGMPERESNAVRVCDYKIKAAVEWAKKLPAGTGAILWVYHQEVGRWVYDLLVKEGLPSVHCPAGNAYNKLILDTDNKDKMVVASMTAHGEGKNLQHFSHQYFLQWPRQAKRAEQVLGRLHRNGQKADEVLAVSNNTLLFDQMNMAACLNDSCYAQQTTGIRQRLMYCSYEPPPKIMPSIVLAERGLDNRILSPEDQRMLFEKFGG